MGVESEVGKSQPDSEPVRRYALSFSPFFTAIRCRLPLPVLHGVETSEARSERVGVRGCFGKDGDRWIRGESPSPGFSACRVKSDLSPQAGRGGLREHRYALSPRHCEER